MKKTIVLLSLLFSSLAFASGAMNRESGGGAPWPQLVCHDQYRQEDSKIVLKARVVSSGKLAHLRVASPGRPELYGQALDLKPGTLSGVEVLTGSIHASKLDTDELVDFPRDFAVIFKIGTAWAEEKHMIRAQLQFYCDECGGGYPSFDPNMYCSIED